MIYFKMITIAIAAVGLLIYTLMFDRKYFFPLLIAEVICTGFLSFYTFYYIGSYSNSDSDVQLNTNLLKKGGGHYSLIIDVEWKQKPEIFGFDGDSDQLVVRYNPQFCEITGADKGFRESKLGMNIVELSDKYKYSEITKKEKEIAFDIKDGENSTTRVDFKEIKQGSEVKVFFLHDFEIPLGAPVYWEKCDVVQFR